jgi:CheY-like chemotaxis protein
VSKRKLLLADDSITIQKVVNLTFADEGIEVISVSDGDAAMRKLVEVSPDLVMADVHMPGISGYQICEKIRENQGFSSIPVILLVGSFEPFDEDEAKRVGADGYLTKPFQSIRQLVNKVTTLLETGRESESDSTENVSNETVSTAESLPIVSAPIETPTFETYSTPLETVTNSEISTSTENFVDNEILETSSLPKIEEKETEIESFSDYSEIKTNYDSNLDDEMIETSQIVEYPIENTNNLDLIEEVKTIEESNSFTKDNSTIDAFETTQEMSKDEIREAISKNYSMEIEQEDSVIETSTVEPLSEPVEKTIEEKSAETIEKEEDKEFVLDSTPIVQIETSPFAKTEETIEDTEVQTNLNETGFDFVKTEEKTPVKSTDEVIEKDDILETKSADENIESIPLPETLTILDFDDQNLLEIAPREEDFMLAENEDEELLVDDVADISQFKSEPKEEVEVESIPETIEKEEVGEIPTSETVTEPIEEEIEEETNTEVLEEPIQETSEEFSTQTEPETVEIVEEKVEEPIVESAEEAIEKKEEVVETPSTTFVSMPIVSETQEKQVEETPIETANVYDEKVSISSLSPELLDVIANRVVEKLSERVIREIAWEVVPQHVDLIVKKMVEEKLKEN